MGWMAVVQGVVGAANGYLNAKAQNAVTEANNRISKANAEAGNKLKQAGNMAAAAESALARFVQSSNNNRELDAGGNALEANTVNARRRSDANLAGGFAADLRSAEQQGAAAAAAAVSGIDGNVVDMVNVSTALRDSIVQQSVDDRQSMIDYDTSRRAGTIMSQMVSGLDSSVIVDGLNYNIDMAQRGSKKNTLFAVLDGATNALIGSKLGQNTGNPATPDAVATDNDAAYQAPKRNFAFGHDGSSSYGLWGGDADKFENENPTPSGSFWSR